MCHVNYRRMNADRAKKRRMQRGGGSGVGQRAPAIFTQAADASGMAGWEAPGPEPAVVCSNEVPFAKGTETCKVVAEECFRVIPKPALTRVLADRPDLHEVVFQHVQAIDTSRLIREGRVYGGGLHELEPGELAGVAAGAVWEAVCGHYSEGTVVAGLQQLPLAW